MFHGCCLQKVLLRESFVKMMLVTSSRVDSAGIPPKTACLGTKHGVRPCMRAVRVKNSIAPGTKRHQRMTKRYLSALSASRASVRLLRLRDVVFGVFGTKERCAGGMGPRLVGNVNEIYDRAHRLLPRIHSRIVDARIHCMSHIRRLEFCFNNYAQDCSRGWTNIDLTALANNRFELIPVSVDLKAAGYSAASLRAGQQTRRRSSARRHPGIRRQ